MDIIEGIRRRQGLMGPPSLPASMQYQPEMLYIGCIDARLDPIDDIGIGQGRALIFRNIGALVLRDERPDGHPGCGTIPQSVSIGAVLEFFLGHVPFEPDKAKHIVISGHTDCNGLKACRDDLCGERDHHLPLYLENLKGIRAEIMKEAGAKGWDDAEVLHALQNESVRQSMRNLLTYSVVRQAMEEGRLETHGWVIDTATKRISEMNPETLAFEPMV